jgi:hypothetical protein
MAGCGGSQNGEGLGIVIPLLGLRMGLDVGRLTVGDGLALEFTLPPGHRPFLFWVEKCNLPETDNWCAKTRSAIALLSTERL